MDCVYKREPDYSKVKTYTLAKEKHKPGNVVQRFVDWRKGEPTVIIDNSTWIKLQNPESVTLTVDIET